MLQFCRTCGIDQYIAHIHADIYIRASINIQYRASIVSVRYKI